MQDSPASKRARVFAERDCPDCGKPFTPRSGRQVRCAECREGPPAAVCGKDGCGTQLRRDNKIGYCEPHKRPTARAPERFCTEHPCGRKLRIDNESGYCPDHARLSQGNRESRDRLNARLRAETAARPDLRPECSVKECDNRLRSDNATGRCPEHHYAPLDLPECALDGCDNRLTAQNTGDRCYRHAGKYWSPDAPKCGDATCGKTLHADNQTGYCHKHRGQSPVRLQQQRDYYQSRREDLVEYARLYREIYAEEHRASARAHYAMYGRINPEAQRAAAARRRQRAEHGMDAIDMMLSWAYRQAIKNDPCFYCGSAETDHVDHYFPLAKGGNDAWVNLVKSCQRCNLEKFTKCGTAYLLRFRPAALAA